MVAYVRNPLTGRRIKANGATAQIPAVRSRMRGTTFRGTKRTGDGRYRMADGTKAQVWHGTAKHTVGGVTRSGLKRVVDKWGKSRIVFRSRSDRAKENPVMMAYAQAARASGRFGGQMG